MKTTKKHIFVSYGEDGNPEVETNCVEVEAAALCAALLTALASASGAPASYLEAVVMKAANLLDRMEVDVDARGMGKER